MTHTDEIDIWSLIQESNVINFGLMAVVIVFVIAKFLPKAAKGTQEKISIQIKEAQETRKSAERKLEELESKLSSSQKETSNIILDAQKTAEEIKSKIKDETDEQIKRLKDLAEKDILAKKNEAINSIKEIATKVSINLAEENIKLAAKDPRVLKNLQSKFKKELGALN